MILINSAEELDSDSAEEVIWPFVALELQYRMNDKNKAHVAAVTVSHYWESLKPWVSYLLTLYEVMYQFNL